MSNTKYTINEFNNARTNQEVETKAIRIMDRIETFVIRAFGGLVLVIGVIAIINHVVENFG
jgi:hypothetical protein